MNTQNTHFIPESTSESFGKLSAAVVFLLVTLLTGGNFLFGFLAALPAYFIIGISHAVWQGIRELRS